MVLSFRGEIGSGKTTAANFFAEKWGFHKVSLADPLKVEVYAALAIGAEELELFSNELNDPSVTYPITNLAPPLVSSRQEQIDWVNKRKSVLGPLLQWWGTEYRRKRFGEDYWLKRFKILCPPGSSTHFVVDDCRFDNEIDYIQSIGGKHVYIVNKRASAFADERNGNGGELRRRTHASEKSNDPFDPRIWKSIDNSGTLDDFKFELALLAITLCRET